MTVNDLNIEPSNNYVLIKPYDDMDQSNIQGLSLDTSFNPAAHAARRGVVIALPKSLYFDPDDTGGMPWLTQIELEVGDEVTYHYLSALTAEEPGMERFFIFNNEKYYFIKYDRIFTSLRKDIFSDENPELTCLNGFVLVEPVQERSLEKYATYIDIPQRSDKFWGIVKYRGSLIRHYGSVYADYHSPDQDNIYPGDLVVMDQMCDIPLEYPLHAAMDEIYYRVQRRYIIGKDT